MPAPTPPSISRRPSSRSAIEGGPGGSEKLETLRDALQAFESIGAALWADRARGELARISGRRASGTSLTDAEKRVVDRAVIGLTNQEIATELSLSVRTVEGHLSSY